MATTPVGNPYVESSDLVANYPATSLALANRVDVVGVNPFADAAARTTAIPSPVEGQMSSLADTDSVERYDGSAWVAVGPGKILQVVRATDSTTRSTTSTSYVDVTGMAVTITPQKADSSIIVVAACMGTNSSASGILYKVTTLDLTDAGNTTVIGGGGLSFGGNDFTMTGTVVLYETINLWGYATPGSTSPVTYKMRFKSGTSVTSSINNGSGTGQIYAIEVAA